MLCGSGPILDSVIYVVHPAGNYIILQAVPHHIRLFIALNCDFQELSENLKGMNHLRKFFKAKENLHAENTRAFE